MHLINGATLHPVGHKREVNVAKEAGQPGEDKERTLPYRRRPLEGERCAAHHDSRVGGGTRKAQQVTVNKLAEALGVEPSKLANDEGVTILEQREGNRARVVRRYDDYTLDIRYDTSRLDEAYRLILEGLDGWEEIQRLMPALKEKFG